MNIAAFVTLSSGAVEASVLLLLGLVWIVSSASAGLFWVFLAFGLNQEDLPRSFLVDLVEADSCADL